MKNSIFITSLRFFAKFAPAILGVSLMVSFGRVIQIGWGDDLSTAAYFLLEFFVEGLRVIILLFIIGRGSVSGGIQTITSIFKMPKDERDSAFTKMGKTFKLNWIVVLRGILFYGAAIISLNYLIGWMAGTSVAHTLLLDLGLPGSNENTLHTAATLFLKNLTVIPFTIIFQYLLVLYLLNPTSFRNPSSDFK